ncbi:Ribonuclease H-like superfamily [Sesbania bispinosa]|nr:Ribonuclease H-like superfamily [Sesbania bispinosa]
MAELRGVCLPLELAWHKGLRKVSVECDFQVGVQLIQQGTQPSHPYYFIVHRIRGMLLRDWKTHLSHVWREANTVADHLAGFVSQSHFDVNIFLQPPDTGLLHVYYDSIGNIRSRGANL